MSNSRQSGWLTRGTFLIRMAKESLIVFPVALLMSFYGVLRLSSRFEVSNATIVGFALLLTVCMSAWFARKSLRQFPEPGPHEPSSQAPIEPK